MTPPTDPGTRGGEQEVEELMIFKLFICDVLTLWIIYICCCSGIIDVTIRSHMVIGTLEVVIFISMGRFYISPVNVCVFKNWLCCVFFLCVSVLIFGGFISLPLPNTHSSTAQNSFCVSACVLDAKACYILCGRQTGSDIDQAAFQFWKKLKSLSANIRVL